MYLTGPYNGAPYGLSISVPATAGPFNLGKVVTRATLNVDKTTAQVTAESTLPTIFKGIPLRLRSINVNVNKQGFLFNPTNCSPLSTVTTLTSTEGATTDAHDPLPGGQLLGAVVRAQVHRDDVGEDVAWQRREPEHDDHPGRRARRTSSRSRCSCPSSCPRASRR